MAEIKDIKKGTHDNGEQYTEFSVWGDRDVIVVQSTGECWYIYRNSPGAKGMLITLGYEENRNDAEKFANGYIVGM